MLRPANNEERTLHLSVLLTFIAGFCDAATFVAADKLLSAHVLGNLLVFAYNAVQQLGKQDWVRLASLPIFLVSVIIGWWISRNSTNRYALLWVEGSILVGSNLLWLLLLGLHQAAPEHATLVALAIVFAMGLQSTFTQLFSEETDGLTTVATGRVVRVALFLVKRWPPLQVKPSKTTSFKRQALFIASFVVGGLLGAIGAKKVGLPIVVVPGILLLFFARSWQVPDSDEE